MFERYKALLGPLIAASAMQLNAIVPADAAELYRPRHYGIVRSTLLSYPYGGTYQDINRAKRTRGIPYVGFYYGSYYGLGYQPGAPANWNDYDPFFNNYGDCRAYRHCKIH